MQQKWGEKRVRVGACRGVVGVWWVLPGKGNNEMNSSKAPHSCVCLAVSSASPIFCHFLPASPPSGASLPRSWGNTCQHVCEGAAVCWEALMTVNVSSIVKLPYLLLYKLYACVWDGKTKVCLCVFMLMLCYPWFFFNINIVAHEKKKKRNIVVIVNVSNP